MQSLVRWMSRRSLRFAHALGALLGWASWMLSPGYRRRFAENAALAGVAPAARRGAVAAAGRLVAEIPFLWLRPASRPIAPLLRWQGDELIAAAHKAGRGIVYLTPHMGCFEVIAQGLAERYGAGHGPLTVLYRPARKRWLRELEETSRARPGLATAPASLAGVRQMMRALRRHEAVGLLPDQVPPDGQGVWAPFFGQPAYTMTLAARLVQQTGAALLLAWGERLPHGQGYVLHFSALPEPLPADTDAQAESAAVINRAMERLIAQCPQQYLWGYHRYKAPRSAA
jgi:KDO2-lipid IV(A) lauroyltransferase